MDPPIHALKFAEDLILHILARHNVIKDPEQWGFMRNLEVFLKQRCPLPVCEAVLGLMEYRKDRIQASFDELCNIKVFNLNDFRFELSITAIMYFQEGYDHLKFLNYCALLGGLSVRYAKAGHREIPTGCSQLLAYFLNFWMYSMVFDPNSDYFELACVAQRVRRNLLLMKENKDLNVADGVSEEVKDTQKVPEKDEEIQKTPKKSEDGQKTPKKSEDGQKTPKKSEDGRKTPKMGDEVSSEKHGKEDQKKTNQQIAEEMAKAFIEAIDKGIVGKNTPKKKGKEKLPETQQKGELLPEKMPGNDGVPEMPKYKRPQKARRGGKK